MANLVVDIGNSLIKAAVFNNRRLEYVGAFEVLQPQVLEELIARFAISNSILSSVAADENVIEELLAAKTTYQRYSVNMPAGIHIRYQSIETLGLDRLAGVIGARTLFPNQNCLVVDAGTCITYDAVDKEGNYSGGSISPGIKMRFKALHQFTDRLPLVEPETDFSAWIGYDTRTSLLSGVLEGAGLEAQGFIEKYNTRYAELKVVLCGGDVAFFDTRLKNSIFAHSIKIEPHLVLIGLNEVIHHYND